MQPRDLRLAYRCRAARRAPRVCAARVRAPFATAMVALTMPAPSSSPAAVPAASIGANSAHGPASRLIELATRRPADFMASASRTASLKLPERIPILLPTALSGPAVALQPGLADRGLFRGAFHFIDRTGDFVLIHGCGSPCVSRRRLTASI